MTTPSRRPHPRALLVLPAGVALVAGIDAGLTLLDAWPPVHSHRLGELHGVLMVVGFLGTLIALERAVALAAPWGFLAPALLGAGALLLLLPLGLDDRFGGALLVAGAAIQCLVQVPLWRRQRDDAVLVPALGSVALLGGTVLWVGGANISVVVVWFAGYVVLTIAGERLELARLAMPATAGRDLFLLGCCVATTIPAATLWPDVGSRLFGVTLLGSAWWLVTHDVARRTVRSTGLPRFAAACMLAGQAWLFAAGAVWLVAGSLTEGPAYDAALHAVFLGFAMSMVFAHASTILPAVTRIRLPHSSGMWWPWAVLHGSLLLRVYAGDVLGQDLARRIGGAGNGAALVLFLLVAVGGGLFAAPGPSRTQALPTDGGGPR